MSSARAITGVSRTLGALITARTGLTVELDLSPADPISDAGALVHLYLYRIELSAAFRNGEWLRRPGNAREAPPLALDLFYLITPHGPTQQELQATLGEVVQAFYDTPIVPVLELDPLIADTTESLRIVPHPLSLQELTDFWRAFDGGSYRLCVAYQASVALIDSTRVRVVHPVEERLLALEPT